MEFEKDFLIDLLDSGKATIEDTITGKGRWSIQHRWIFKHDDKFFEAQYSHGATENQDESPFEHSGMMIECPEVNAVEKTVTVYERALNKKC